MTINHHGQPIGPEVPWEAARPPQRTVLEGRWCRLEPLAAAQHAADLHAAYAADNGSMWTYMPYGPFLEEDSYRAWCEEMERGDDPLFYAVVDQGTDRALGVASFLRIVPAVGVIEVGHIAWSPALQRSTLATEAMFLMMRHVFDDLGYRRYEWKCDDLNAPSRRAAERLGFTFEGVFRQATLYKGRNRDTAWYSVLDSEWPRLRAGYERWLAPTNFDGAGAQRESLSLGESP